MAAAPSGVPARPKLTSPARRLPCITIGAMAGRRAAAHLSAALPAKDLRGFGRGRSGSAAAASSWARPRTRAILLARLAGVDHLHLAEELRQKLTLAAEHASDTVLVMVASKNVSCEGQELRICYGLPWKHIIVVPTFSLFTIGMDLWLPNGQPWPNMGEAWPNAGKLIAGLWSATVIFSEVWFCLSS